MQKNEFSGGLEESEEGPPESAAKRRVCKDAGGFGQESARKCVNGVAKEETDNESVSDMRQKRGAQHKLPQTPSPKVAQESVFRERRQRNDSRNSQSTLGSQHRQIPIPIPNPIRC